MRYILRFLLVALALAPFPAAVLATAQQGEVLEWEGERHVPGA